MTNHHKTPESANATPDTGEYPADSPVPTSKDELDMQAATILAENTPKKAEIGINNLRITKLFGLPSDGADLTALLPYFEARTRHAEKGIYGRALALTAIVGLFIGGYAANDVGEVKYAMRNSMGILPDNIPGQIYPDNVMTGDTITIPGTTIRFPNPITATYGELETHSYTNVERHTTTASTVEEMAENPFGWNLQLQGNEKALDAEALQPAIHEIKDTHGNISRIVVHGIVSDDFNNGNLGKTDPQQHALAEARAEAGNAALSSVAQQEGVTLPKDIILKASEHVLSERDLKQIDTLAQQLHLSTNELIAKYNSGDDLPDNIKEVLAKKLVRGVEYDIDYTTKTNSTSYELVPAGKEADSVKPWQVAALFGGLSAGLTWPISMLAQMQGVPRKRRKQARKYLKKLQ
ncbi:hypothetical protein KBD87_00770 [Candidatus Saccharibacteria bacterium]|nr:hypothetical protein [Candidatus Saccharibacteria bacterium]